MELQLTPAETSQEASGERLWAGVGGWGPGGHVRGGRTGGPGVGLLLTTENGRVCTWTCSCMDMSLILVRTFDDKKHSQTLTLTLA